MVEIVYSGKVGHGIEKGEIRNYILRFAQDDSGNSLRIIVEIRSG
jgi:hypothetical protein